MEVDSLNRASMPTPITISKKPAANGSSDESLQAGEQQRTAASTQNGKAVKAGKPSDKLYPAEEGTNEEIDRMDANITEEFLQKTIERANKELLGAYRQFSYDVHEKTGQYMVKLIDTSTKEVIREIPPEKTLDAVAKMWELAGILVDEKK